MNEMKVKQDKTHGRDSGVELARIIGCLIVVGVHTCLGTSVNGHYDLTRTYIATIFADGVAIFWMIAGCFLFKNKSYKKLMKKSAKTFVIPMIAFSVFSFLFSDWLIKGEHILASMSHTKEEYLEILRKLISWQNFAENGGHLWYLYVYLLLLVLFPVLKSFVDYLDEDESRVKYFLLISLVVLIINDISKNQFGEFTHHTFRGAIPAAIEMIWGHILYKYREKLINKKYIITSVVMFMVLNCVRTIIQINRGNDTSILYWYSSIGLLCAICVLGFSLSIVGTTIKNQKIISGINTLASFTFSVYIIHPIVKVFFNRLDIPGKMMLYIINGKNVWYREIIYTVVILLAVFITSLLVAIIIKRIVIIMKWVIRSVKVNK